MCEKSKVYFIKGADKRNVLKVYEALGKQLGGRVAVKVHSGERGNQNFLRPEFFREIVERVNGTIVECNTAYPGSRNYSDKHRKLLIDHGWTKYFDVDLMDEVGPDEWLPVPKGSTHLKYDIVGKNLLKYDSMLVLSHFKGHPMGGFGGALKQLSIGCASTAGKVYIHSAGKYEKTEEQDIVWSDLPPQNDFLESMAEAAGAVADHFKDNIIYISVMANMSVDCDCCEIAEDPCIADVGVLASLDPVAIDRACVDIVKNGSDKGKAHFLERVSSRNGEHTIFAAEKLGVGTQKYELIEL